MFTCCLPATAMTVEKARPKKSVRLSMGTRSPTTAVGCCSSSTILISPWPHRLADRVGGDREDRPLIPASPAPAARGRLLRRGARGG